jgi:hypothetical protein
VCASSSPYDAKVPLGVNETTTIARKNNMWENPYLRKGGSPFTIKTKLNRTIILFSPETHRLFDVLDKRLELVKSPHQNIKPG